MTYKDLLRLYKSGELDAQQSAEVEKDIEKQEAISEYLFEAEGIPEFSDFDVQTEGEISAGDSEEKRFMKMINKSIRRAFIKLGVAVGVIVLAVVIVASTALPYIVDACYYNPSKIVGEGDGWNTNQMSLDTAIYTELFTPGYYRIKAEAKREGYGNYDICIPQNFSVNGQFRDVYGSVEKGKLTLYSDGLFKLPAQNAFVPEDILDVKAVYSGTGAAGSAQDAMEKLNALDKNDYYVGYVTLNKVMTYDELVKWSKATGVVPDWCAVCKKEKNSYEVDDIVGFNYLSSSGEMAYDNEKYPYLNYFDMVETVDDFPEDAISTEVMEAHMTSMLRFMADREEFRDMVGCITREDVLEQFADNIEENGLNIYGFAIVAQKDKLIEISSLDDVHYIYTTPLT